MATQQRTRAKEFDMEGSSAGHSRALTERRRHRRRAPRLRSQSHTDQGQGLADFLGWFSIGLGLAQLVAPKGVANLIGLDHDRGMMRYLGAREMTAGLGVLTQQNQSTWLWGRVAGDMMDLALLASAFGARGARPDRLAGATAAVLGVTMLDIMAAKQRGEAESAQPGSQRHRHGGAVESTKVMTIDASPEELYRFWRNFENLPKFMSNLESVRTLDDHRSHWIAKGPAGSRYEWDAEITDDQPNRSIAWRSIGHADVHNWGRVRFDKAPGDRGTEVRVKVRYEPPGGQIGAAVAWLMGQAPEQRIQEDLRRLKRFFELGETPTTEGQSSGRKSAWDRFSVVGIVERDMR
jgi:uncharacterized membrane protein